jgi:WD40 repeat protein
MTLKVIESAAVHSRPAPAQVVRVAWGGSKLFASDQSFTVHATDDLEVWSVVLQHTHSITALETSPNGGLLAVGDSNRIITILNTADLTVLHSWPYHTSLVSSIAWHSGSDILVSCSVDRNIILWSVAKGGPLETILDTHRFGVNAVCFIEADLATTVVSAGADGVLRFWRCLLA